MALLFGNTAGRNQSKNLVEFRAGKMQMKGNVVHAETRKGLVYVHQTESDSLMHFCWKDRVSGTVEDDLIIFPDDVEFKRVQQCTTGRVYLLKFKSSNRKLFFWMQDPKTDKDDENCAKVNEYLNNPPAPGSARSGGSTPGALGADIPADADLQNLLSTMSQQQFMQLLGGMSGVGGMANLSNYLSAHGLGSQFGSGSSSQSARRSGQSSAAASVANASAASTAATTATTTTTTTAASATTTAAAAVTTTSTATNSSTASTTSTTVTATPSLVSAAAASATAAPSAEAVGSQVQLSDLQSILSGISVQPGEDQSKPPASVATVNPLSGVSATAVDLSTAMTTEALQPILSNPEFLQRLQDLLPQTGGISGTASAPAEQLQSTVQSPQFQQAVSMFSAALQSGQLGPLLQQFGLSDEVVNAAAQGDMETFINVLQASHNEDAVKKEKGNDDDDEMALD